MKINEILTEAVKQRLDAKCWTGKHKEGTKIKGGVRVNNCVPNESINEAKQLSVEQLATISDAALDSAYGYGRSQPGNTFGWQANLKSATYAKQIIDKGVTDVETISDAIHRGWNVTAQAFVKNPMQFDDSKTMAPEKLQAKIAQRQKLMTQNYAQLPEEEKEKDRVVARAMLQAITGGEQSVAEAGEWPDKMSHDDLENMQRNHQKWSEQDTPDRTDPSATVEDFYHEVVRLGPGLGRDLLYFAAEEGDEPRHIVKAARQLYKKIAQKAGLNPEIGSSDNNKVFDLMYDWVGKNYRNPDVAEAVPLARDSRRELVAPTDRDRIRRELWKYVGSLDQEGNSNRAHDMAHGCPTWGRLYRQFNDDVSQLLSRAPTELLAQALREIQSKFQGVAEDTELAKEFDLIERIIEDLAERNRVDAEAIWEDLESLSDDELYVFATTVPVMEDWQKVNKRDKTDGMSRKAVNSYRREHPGSKLKTAVTTKPSKLKKGSKASKRRKSYCSRSKGQMKMHNISCAKTPDKAICKARRRWNC
jgi:hypothetical protein